MASTKIFVFDYESVKYIYFAIKYYNITESGIKPGNLTFLSAVSEFAKFPSLI